MVNDIHGGCLHFKLVEPHQVAILLNLPMLTATLVGSLSLFCVSGLVDQFRSELMTLVCWVSSRPRWHLGNGPKLRLKTGFGFYASNYPNCWCFVQKKVKVVV